VTKTPNVLYDLQLRAEPMTSLDGSALLRAPQQIKCSVYATFWQARSGFFDPPPKSPVASIDSARSGYDLMLLSPPPRPHSDHRSNLSPLEGSTRETVLDNANDQLVDDDLGATVPGLPPAGAGWHQLMRFAEALNRDRASPHAVFD
jgi:hypothetical protein